MADTVTTKHGFVKPEVNASDDTWGTKLNSDLDSIDSKLDFRSTTTEVLTGTAADRTVTPDALAALWEMGAGVASASTLVLGEGGVFTITGSVTIVDIDWAVPKDGRAAWLFFSGVLTITHGANLQLPGNQNIVTAAGDRALFIQWNGDQVLCMSYLRAAVSPAVAAGVVSAFAGATAPAGWLMCQGQLINRVTYATLYAVIGTTYGVGDGSTTFGLPDLRGRVVAGVDAGAGRLPSAQNRPATGGVDSGTLASVGGEDFHYTPISELNQHQHGIPSYGTDNGTQSSAFQRQSVLTTDISNSNPFTVLAGGDLYHNNVQPTIVLNYIISTGGI
jgi:microcystin-dependent protein